MLVDVQLDSNFAIQVICHGASFIFNGITIAMHVLHAVEIRGERFSFPCLYAANIFVCPVNLQGIEF